MKLPFRIMIDASAMKKGACLLQLFNTVIHGYRPKLNSIQIEFGQAFHKFRAHIRTNGTHTYGSALQEAIDYFTTVKYTVPSHKKYMDNPDYLKKACLVYLQEYFQDKVKPLYLNNNPAIELPFCLPYYVDDTVEVYLTGTIDELGNEEGKINLIVDCKTTSQWDLDKFLQDFLLSGQLLFYRNIIKIYHELYASNPNRYANVKCLSDLHISDPAVMIDCLNTKGKDDIKVKRSTKWLIRAETLTEYSKLLSIRIAQLVQAVKDYFLLAKEPLREGMLTEVCDGRFDKCAFHQSCCMPDDISRKEVLDMTFIKRPYNPLEFQTLSIQK